MSMDNDEAWTRVEVSFYKPQGYIDTWYVHTDDRGLALRSALKYYGKERLRFINYANMVTGPRPADEVIERCCVEVIDEPEVRHDCL